MEFDPHTRLAGECLQPLGHLSPRKRRASVEPFRPHVSLAVAIGYPVASAGPAAAAAVRGRVAERLNAAVLKTVDGGNVVRGFESPPFRS
jgi:hypothetical protein